MYQRHSSEVKHLWQRCSLEGREGRKEKEEDEEIDRSRES
jgi:hypothetical protein